MDEAKWQWRSRVKGGAWDAWEQGRFGQEVPPFMEIEERTVPASPAPALPESGAEAGLKEALALSQLESLVAAMFRAEQEYDRARRLERGDRQSRDTVVRAEQAYDKARFDLKRAIPKQLLIEESV